jgi:D-xylose 1-dehydrogenase (NADP+, D-xylono-1,5-lactone-forming)
MLRWGLLGTAHVNRRIIPAMRAARRSTVDAVASRDARRADLFARQWAIPVAHPTYESLLRDAGVDAVYIPLPNALHVEWTLRALDAGKHVLCEKPLALTAEDVERVDAVARARERVVAEAFMFRHEPLTARVLELTAPDVIGSLRTITAGFTFPQHRTDDVRLDPELGGGSLWDVGCYAVNAARLVARAEPVEAFGWAAAAAPGSVDESFTGLLRFPSGTIATIHSGFRAPYRTWLEVVGSAGVVRVNNLFKPSRREEVELRQGDRIQMVAVDGSPLLFVRQIDDFVGAALDGHRPAVSLQDSHGNAAALAALLRSAQVNRPVQL